MFPRIKKSRRAKRSYEYLVISESVRDDKGRSTTRDLANLGNVARFSKDQIKGLVDGLIRLFKLDDYCLSDQVQILSSLEHGSVVFWRKLWQRLGLAETIRRAISSVDPRITIEPEKYIEMMVVSRCVDPMSKLATSRWVDTTCYRVLKGYAHLSRDVQYFYRSMDYLLQAKEEIERAVFSTLRDLFSINVRLTFYDITSTFFYGGHCPIADNGYSRDMRPDKVQVVIGVVTSDEGYPIKHWVFEGNRQDQTTVIEVVEELKREFNIVETIFVGDRGMISRLNLERILSEGYSYIMGVKARQDEMMPMILEDASLFKGKPVGANPGLSIVERQIAIKEFLAWKVERVLKPSAQQKRSRAWKTLIASIEALDNDTELTVADLRSELDQLKTQQPAKRKLAGLLKKYRGRYEETRRFICARNPRRASQSATQRAAKIKKLGKELHELFAAPSDQLLSRIERVFGDHNRAYRRFFSFRFRKGSEIPQSYEINQAALKQAKFYDGVFVLATNRFDLSAEEVVSSYKNLQEVEMLFDDLKHFVDIHPVRHWLEHRVCAHVFLCIQALLLKRVLEIDCLGSKALTATLETVATSKLVHYRVRMSERSDQTSDFWRVTNTTPEQAACFAAVGIKNPQSLEDYAW